MLIHEGEFKSIGDLSAWERHIRVERNKQWVGFVIYLDRGNNKKLTDFI